ncbi:MAG TPA: hypothetical protein VF777_08030 [Phycisphaerales bacterium]
MLSLVVMMGLHVSLASEPAAMASASEFASRGVPAPARVAVEPALTPATQAKTDTTPAAAPAAAVPAAKPDPAKPETKPEAKPEAKPEEAKKPAANPPATLAELKEQYPTIKATQKDDGTFVIDEKFAVTGKGTKDNPYVVTWEHLVSVSELYDPKRGQKKLPDRVMFLDGAYVTITGYVAFPLYVAEPKELLCMLNQWDGCCIGVPPTPYDAIEVKLKDAATKEQRMTTFGTVSGKLFVKPYLVGDWLVGLYLMEEASMGKPKPSNAGT